ncbi:MAG: YdcF family protein [bacterium]
MTPVFPFRTISRWKKSVSALGGLIVLFCVLVLSTSWTSNILIRPLTISDVPTSADAIIVLGAGTEKGSDPLPLQAHQRIQKGVDLLVSNVSAHLIVTGGLDKKTQRVEATYMKEEALRDGANASVVIMEPSSKSTYENATNALAIVRANNWTSIVVVTSDYHTWRACHVFRKQWDNVTCVAATTFDPAHNSVRDRLIRFRSVVREYGAIVYYAMRGYL